MKERTHVYRSLLRRQLFLGCDRELVMMLIMLCLLAAFLAADPAGIALSLLCLIAGFAALRAVALKDPLWRRVYLRALRYRGVYQARADLLAPKVQGERS